MEYYGATMAFSRLHQTASSSVATNFSGGAAPMDIGAIKGAKGQKGHKGKRQRKKRIAKARKDPKEKATVNKAKDKDTTPFKAYFPGNKGT